MNFWNFCINHGKVYMANVIEKDYPEYVDSINIIEKYILPKPIISCEIDTCVKDDIVIKSIEDTVKLVNKNIHKTHKQIIKRVEEEKILKNYKDVDIKDLFPNSKRKLFKRL